MFKYLVKNSISQNKLNLQQFTCHLCNESFAQEEYLSHINKESHKAIIPEPKILQKLENFTEAICEQIVKNSISLKFNLYTCHICICECNEPVQHLKGKSHQKNLKIYSLQNKELEVKTVNEQSASEDFNIQEKNHVNIFKEIDFNFLENNHIHYIKESNLYVCSCCKISLPNKSTCEVHIKNQNHKKLKQEFSSKYNIKYVKKLFSDENYYFYCTKCNIYLSTNNKLLQIHCLMHLYEDEPELNADIIQLNKIRNIKCVVCNIEMNRSEEKLLEHLESFEHIESFKKLISLKNTSYDLNEFGPIKDEVTVPLAISKGAKFYAFNSRRDIYFTYFCKTCYEPINFENSELLKFQTRLKVSRRENDFHKLKHLRIYLGTFKNFYTCNMCTEEFTSVQQLLDHYKSKSHMEGLKVLQSILDDEKKIIKEVCLPAKDKAPKQLQKQLTFSSETTVSKENVPVIKPKSTQKSRIKNNEKFPYNKDILEFGRRYALMCLDSKNKYYIYNYDSKQLEQLQLGVSLIFTKSHNRVCLPCEYTIPYSLTYLYEHLFNDIHILNLTDMQECDASFPQHKENLSDLSLARSSLQEESEEWVKCYSCNEHLPNFDSYIKHHLKSIRHESTIKKCIDEAKSIIDIFTNMFKNPWYYADKFFCKVCKVGFYREISFARHLDDSKHIQQVNESSEETKLNICHVCFSCWYGPPGYSKHYDEYNHIRFLKKNNEMIPNLKQKIVQYLDSAEGYVNYLIKESDKIINMFDQEFDLLNSVVETVKPLYPNATAYAFGSRTSYLGFPNSDVDIFLDCENSYNEIGSKEKSQKYIQKLTYHFLVKNKHIWKKDVVLLEPRVPIIKLEHIPTKLKCDISFLSGLGVEKSNLIRNYVRSSIICRMLILYLKKWFDFCTLYGTRGINAYAISLLVIFFMQQNKILPSVHILIQRKNQSKIVDGWECGYGEELPETKHYDFKTLLQEFFYYYAEFDYQTDVICPLIGHVIKKHCFADFNSIPTEMEIYKNRIRTEEIELFRFESPMCIQDPIDLSQNVTKAVTKKQLRQFILYCTASLMRLVNKSSLGDNSESSYLNNRKKKKEELD